MSKNSPGVLLLGSPLTPPLSKPAQAQRPKKVWRIGVLHVGILLVSVLLFPLSFSARAQPPKKIPRIGFVSGTGIQPQIEAFRRGLRDLGYIEGKNILLEHRYIEGRLDRVPELVAELVQLKVDVLVSGNLAAIRAAKQATKAIPVVMVLVGDPVALGVVDNLAHPGRNVTRLTRLSRELSGKRLELLNDTIPGISHGGVLWNADNSSSAIAYEDYEAAAARLKIQLESLEVRAPNPDLEAALQTAVRRRASALVVVSDTMLNSYPNRIADLAIRNRLPSLCEASDYVNAGGFMSYAASEVDLFRRAANYVDKILKGRKPGDLPVEQPTKFEFVINLKTANQIGLTIPPNVLARADRVIR